MNEQSDFDAALRKFKAELETERRDQRYAKVKEETERWNQWGFRALAAFIGFWLGIVASSGLSDCSDLRHRISTLESKVSK